MTLALTLGVLGGGQLGMMFVQAAAKLGYDVRILAEESGSPAGRIAAGETVGSLSDPDAIVAFARTVDALTWEVENISGDAVRAAERECRVRPHPGVLATVQDRIEQKAFLAKAGLPTAPYQAITSERDLAEAEYDPERPSFLKRARSGYDGRGQARVSSAETAVAAWTEMGRAPCILERAVEFEREFSVIVARDDAGEVVSFPAIENIHVEGILDLSMAPAGIDVEQAKKAQAAARRAVEALDLIGVLCLEFYAVAGHGVSINEIAARPHNSGHLTIEACTVSQFELHVRALAGLPLVQPELRQPAAMANLIGISIPGDGPGVRPVSDGRAFVYDYGKSARPGRKTGHVTALGETRAQALDLALALRAELAGG